LVGARNSYSSFKNHETLWNAGAFAASLSQNHLVLERISKPP
jgi:hypothetical protein